MKTSFNNLSGPPSAATEEPAVPGCSCGLADYGLPGHDGGTDRQAINDLTAAIIREIDADIHAGLVPATVRAFSELHDYVDANSYGDLLVRALETARGWSRTRHINTVTDRIDAWLRAGRPRDFDPTQPTV